VCACSQNCNATANANIVTLTGDYGSTASVQPLGPMHYTRAFCNSVVLPDGTVLVMGGQVKKQKLNLPCLPVSPSKLIVKL